MRLKIGIASRSIDHNERDGNNLSKFLYDCMTDLRTECVCLCSTSIYGQIFVLSFFGLVIFIFCAFVALQTFFVCIENWQNTCTNDPLWNESFFETARISWARSWNMNSFESRGNRHTKFPLEIFRDLTTKLTMRTFHSIYICVLRERDGWCKYDWGRPREKNREENNKYPQSTWREKEKNAATSQNPFGILFIAKHGWRKLPKMTG